MENNIKIIEDHIAGLQERQKTLEASEKLFIKAQGMDEQIEKAKMQIGNLEKEAESIKEEISDLKVKKNQALKSTMDQIQGRMNALLPEGEAVFSINDETGGVDISLNKNGLTIPHNSLSGGQMVYFDTALAYALLGDDDKLIVIEAGEMDKVRLLDTLKKIEDNPDTKAQYIVNTWYEKIESQINIEAETWNIIMFPQNNDTSQISKNADNGRGSQDGE